MVIVVSEKHQQQLFYSRKIPFWGAEVSNTLVTLVSYFLKKCSFLRHINVSCNNQTGFPSQIIL